MHVSEKSSISSSRQIQSIHKMKCASNLMDSLLSRKATGEDYVLIYITHIQNGLKVNLTQLQNLR